MYDELNEELKQMDEIEKGPIQKVEGSLSLSDSIQSMPKQKFLVIKEDTTLKVTLEKLQQYHLGCIVVEKDKKVKGIFTERDILMKVLGKRLNFKTEIVKTFMTKNPFRLRMNDPLAYALNLMVDGGFRHVPIVDNNDKTVGLISMQDVVNHLANFFYDEVMNLPPKPLRIQTQREGG